MNQSDTAELYNRFNLETGTLQWRELERHFARGVVIAVAPGLDLIKVASCMARDNKEQIAGWLETGLIFHATEEMAREWLRRDPAFWATVVAPWVLIQEKTSQGSVN
ncbi:DUF2288 domain-containing protein [Candidatus Methylospira mobilis]|uniref:DUF2288 domain-containing protein n=1 Tax=Candidatus Methylospira mobilis TaxID=1808979 RepID=A0A5Q0BPX8_9GAMM|nr:DUF2288 domain-containing protein [Candidatus Methylospira mobilis]QFY44137.1 DUF2288 domain-containing protein [Candidatus Methylospira mobilis]WNV06446.1 DUF2288 domain-containing protein [Candidatus Methylospira mobilis]